jgi:hypothetical protein
MCYDIDDDYRNIGAIVVNSTPKYFYLLDAFFGMYFRYCNGLSLWPVYFATEVKADGQGAASAIVRRLLETYNIRLLQLEEKDADFLESRVAALRLLPAGVQYVIPLQEDFILERPGVQFGWIQSIVQRMEHNPKIHSARLMPCPGPKGILYEGVSGSSSWTSETSLAYLKPSVEDYMFTFQASIWRRKPLTDYLQAIIDRTCKGYGVPSPRTREYNAYQVNANPAESGVGKGILQDLLGDENNYHLAWIRRGAWPNAVYDCPFPYRPTAIVKGVLQEWAKELIAREGFRIRGEF